MLFQRLIFSALGAALLLGTLQTGVQRLQSVPIILAAEAFEGDKQVAPTVIEAAPVMAQASGHVHGADATEVSGHAHGEAAEQWAPENGAERTFWTWVANVMYAFSMALLAMVIMGASLWRKPQWRTGSVAAGVAAAGWLALHFWPSLGLHAEIPGMDAARLGSRQGWWLLAASSAALACASMAFMKSPVRWLAALAWLAVPFAVGAPHIVADPLAGFSSESQAVLRGLGQQFVWATHWLAVSFWVSLAVVCGLIFERWIRPALFPLLSAAVAPEMKVKA